MNGSVNGERKRESEREEEVVVTLEPAYPKSPISTFLIESN